MSMIINHVLIRTTRLEQMKQFLARIAGLEEGPRPPFQFSGAWMYSGGRPLIHLVEIGSPQPGLTDYLGASSAAAATGAGPVDHIAFSGADYPALMERLHRQRAEFYERTVPESHEHQVFVEGPEGVRLEFMFADNKENL
ncbi:MAG: hypothetical protein DSZ32_01425 [Gammaproteobacteria bacterium]|nr:MAG: hypothetical protein DSZ32_01425 [Gammaproteobacteria bacterium]